MPSKGRHPPWTPGSTWTLFYSHLAVFPLPSCSWVQASVGPALSTCFCLVGMQEIRPEQTQFRLRRGLDGSGIGWVQAPPQVALQKGVQRGQDC